MTTTPTGSITASTPRALARTLVAALVLAGLGPVQALAQSDQVAPMSASQRLRYEEVEQGLVISIRTTLKAPVKVDQEGRDLLILFSDSVPSLDAEALQRSTDPWIESVSIGFDSLLLRLAKGVVASVVSTDELLQLRLSALVDTPVERPDDAAEALPLVSGSLRLDLLRAQLQLRDQDIGGARESFASLRSAMPGQPEPVLGLAQVESQSGRWRRSLALYSEAVDLGGGTPELTAERNGVDRAQASRASIGFEERRSRGGDIDSPITIKQMEFRGVKRIDEAWRVNLEADVADVQTEAVRRPSGAIEAFSGQRNRATLSAQHDAVSGVVTVSSLFLGNASAGLGLLRRLPDDSGATNFVVEGWRNNWDYVEGVVDGALRDRLAISRTQRLQKDLSARIELGTNRYHRSEEGELGRSNSLAFDARMSQFAGIPGLSAVYAVDAEYVDKVTERSSVTGETYALLPLANREVHSVSLGFAHSRGDRWVDGAVTFDGYAGLANDRYGSSGEVAAASISYARGALEVRLKGSHLRNVARSGGTADALGVLLSIQL